MRVILIFLFSVFSFSLFSQSLSDKNRQEILTVLEEQRIAWNKGNLEEYMQGYWKSDSLRFVGKNGIKYGWNATFEGYKKGYPSKEAMGKLTFEVVSIEILSMDYAFMLGKWALERSENNISGFFSLVWRKINGKWRIVTDHSS
jgi:hypothetical protein